MWELSLLCGLRPTRLRFDSVEERGGRPASHGYDNLILAATRVQKPSGIKAQKNQDVQIYTKNEQYYTIKTEIQQGGQIKTRWKN